MYTTYKLMLCITLVIIMYYIYTHIVCVILRYVIIYELID